MKMSWEEQLPEQRSTAGRNPKVPWPSCVRRP